MADHNIEINVDLQGADRAKSDLREIKSAADQLNNTTISPKINTGETTSQVQRVKQTLEGLTSKKNNILDNLGLNDKDVNKQIKFLEGRLGDLKKTYDEALGANQWKRVKGKPTSQDIMREAKKEMDAVNKQLSSLYNVKELTRQIGDVQKLYDSLGGNKQEVQSGPSVEKAAEDLERINQEKEKLETPATLNINADSADDARSKVEKLVGVLETASSLFGMAAGVSSTLGDFGGFFASALDGMSNMFKFDALGTASRYLTAMATRAVTSQVSGIIERYDIMSSFVPYMGLAGVDEVTAQKSLNAVDQSIRGIPIGLDEAAFRLRKYQMYMNDIDRATNFTIGIQKAITAGGASEQMKTTAYTQIDRLLATGKLGQSRQWLSLFNGLGVSLRFLREELALDPTADLKQIAGDLANGTIATEDFIDAIARLADNQGLDKALEIYKGTVGAWKANIDNAIKRGGQHVLESVNDVLDDVYGQGITGFMKDVRDGIDKVSTDASSYIKDNPQHVQTIGDAIEGLLQQVFTLDGGRFVNNVVSNVSGLMSAIGSVLSSLPPGFLEDFSSFAVTWAGPMATVMKAAQSGVGVLFGVFERMKDFDMEDLLGKITGQIEKMAGAVSTLLGKIPDGLLGDLMSFGLVWGKPLAAVFSGISTAIKDVAGVISSGGALSAANGILGQLTALAMNFPVLTVAAGAITAFAGALAYYNEVQTQTEIDNMKMNIGDIDSLVEKTNSLIKSTDGVTERWSDNIGSFNEKANEAHDAVQKIRDLNDEIEELSKPLPYSNMGDTKDDLLAERLTQIERLSALFPDLRLEVDEVTGALTEQSQAMLEQADTYIDYMTGISLAKGYREAIEAESDAIVELQLQREEAIESSENASRYLAREERSLEHFETEVARIRKKYKIGKKYDEAALANDEEYANALENRDKSQRGVILAEDEAKKAERAVKDYDDAIAKHYDTIEKYGRSLSELRAQQVKRGGEEWWFEGEKTALEDLDEDLQNIIADYELMREEANKAITSAIGGFEKIEQVNPQSLSTTTGNVEANNEVGQYYEDQLAILQQWMDGQLLTEEGREFLEQNGAAIQKLIDESQSDFGDRGLLYGLVDAITGGDQEALDEYFQSQLDQLNITGNISGIMSDIEAMLKYGSQWKEFRDENSGEEEFSWMREGLAENVVTPLIEMAEQLSPEGETGAALTEATAQTVEGIVQSIEPVNAALDGAVDSSHILESAIVNLATTASGQAGTMQSFAGSLDSVAGSAANAFSNVSALAGAISRLQDKTITIRINVLGSLGHLAQGGMAGYFASGGNVNLGFPGMGSGSDIVPAWLTPGEFVMRRGAVGLFGRQFMDRVNKMDIGGAFDALMSRIANPMSHGNTYNRDNHAQVINNFYGNSGQNYSQRKAYRFVGSL